MPPIRILELRSARGTGGGPEKTILRGAAQSDPARFAVTVCYLRDRRDDGFGLERLARAASVADYVELLERHSFDYKIWPQLRALVAARRIDIVHSHDHKTDVLALALAWTAGIAPLSTVHGWSGVSVRERWLYYPVDRAALRWFPRVIAVSTPIQQRLVSGGVSANRVVKIVNGIDPAAFRRRADRVEPARRTLGLAPDATVVGAIGRLEREKRYDVLVDAFALLFKDRPQSRLVLVGDGSERRALEELAAARGVSPACVFAGTRSDVADIAHAIDVIAQSSDTEGTSNTILEAMALEIPIVATDVGGTADLITTGLHGRLVPRRDPQALAAALGRTLDDRDTTRAMVAAARHRVEHELSFAARMRAVEQIYVELAAGRSAGRARDIAAWETACEKD